MATDDILEVRDLCVDYVTEAGTARAVDHVSLNLARSEFLGVVGESGCGKSTLVFAIAQLLAAPAEIVAGSVSFKGTEMVELAEGKLRALRWRDLSIVMQSAMNALNPVKRIEAQFQDALRAHGVSRRDREFIRARSAEVFHLVGIDPAHLRSYPHQLSGGMRQRAMIAMALLFSAELIIMDEPTSALDVVAQRALMLRIRELQDSLGFAVIFVTHDLSLVSHFSDRLAVMYAGQLYELGPTRAVFDVPRHPYTKGLLDAFPSIRGQRVPLLGIAGSPPDLTRPPHGCRFAPRCPDVIHECKAKLPLLYEAGESKVRCFQYQEDGPFRVRNGQRVGQTAGGDDNVIGERGVTRTAVHVSSDRASSLGELSGDLVGEPQTAPTQLRQEGGVDAGEERAILRTAGLSQHFRIGGLWGGHVLHAVDDVNLVVREREIVAVVGESGSGKSTLARLLARAYRPTSGEIYFHGRALSTLKSRPDLLAYRAAVPMVFQDPYGSANPNYRVSYALSRTVKLHRPDIREKEMKAEIERVLEAVELAPARIVRNKYPHELSGGQRQRVGFAQALLSRPQAILADEPVSMLDVSIRIGLLNLMDGLRKDEGVSFFYVTHDVASPRYVADRLVVMYAGSIVESGAVEDVLQHPRHPYTELLLATVPDPRVPLAASLNTTGEPAKVIDPGEGCRFRDRCSYAVEMCESVTPLLRDVGYRHEAACHLATSDGLPRTGGSSDRMVG